jgi:hypothetical protein
MLMDSQSQRAHRLRMIGVLIGVLGIASAGIVYWHGSRAPDFSDDASMVGYSRAARRQVGIMYGKFGELTESLSNDLKQPGTQAILIALVSVSIAIGCFHFARLLDYDSGPE